MKNLLVKHAVNSGLQVRDRGSNSGLPGAGLISRFRRLHLSFPRSRYEEIAEPDARLDDAHLELERFARRHQTRRVSEFESANRE